MTLQDISNLPFTTYEHGKNHIFKYRCHWPDDGGLVISVKEFISGHRSGLLEIQKAHLSKMQTQVWFEG